MRAGPCRHPEGFTCGLIIYAYAALALACGPGAPAGGVTSDAGSDGASAGETGASEATAALPTTALPTTASETSDALSTSEPGTGVMTSEETGGTGTSSDSGSTSASASESDSDGSTTDPQLLGCDDGDPMPGEFCFDLVQVAVGIYAPESGLIDLNHDQHLDLVLLDVFLCPDVPPAPQPHAVSLKGPLALTEGPAPQRDGASGQRLVIGLGDGTGAFAFDDPPWFEHPIYAFVLGEFTGDGHPDAAVLDKSALILYAGDGAGALAAGDPIPIPGEPHELASGDLDGDGDLDLVAPLDGEILVLLSDGQGGFTSVTQPVAITFDQLLVHDLDGGALDLVARDASPGTVATFLGVGDGSFANGTSVETGWNARGVAVGRLIGDAPPAVIAASVEDKPAAYLLENLGGGLLDAPVSLGATHANLIAVGDFDVDAHEDLLVLGVEGIHVVPGAAGWPEAPVYIKSQIVYGATEVAVGDINEDGIDDAVYGYTGVQALLSAP